MSSLGEGGLHKPFDVTDLNKLAETWHYFFVTPSPAVDMAGGAPEGAAGRRLCRVGRGRPGSDQTLWPTAADYTAGHCQRHQGGGGPHPAAEVKKSDAFSCVSEIFSNVHQRVLPCHMTLNLWKGGGCSQCSPGALGVFLQLHCSAITAEVCSDWLKAWTCNMTSSSLSY